MQVKLGPLVTAAAGSIGGTTFQRNPVATLVRSKPLPILRRSAYTGNARGWAQHYSRLWRTLTTEQREAWQTTADELVWLNKFGDVIRGLGYWLFLRCNQYLGLISSPAITDPGTVAAMDAIVDPSGAFSIAGNWPIDWTSPGGGENVNVWAVFASPGMSAGRSAPFGRQRFIGTIPIGSTPTVDMFTAYAARFPSLPSAGQVVFGTLLPIDEAAGYQGVPVNFTSEVS